MYQRRVFFQTILLVCNDKLCAHLVKFCRRGFFQYCETESCHLSVAALVASVSRFLGAFCELSARSKKLEVREDKELHCETVLFC